MESVQEQNKILKETFGSNGQTMPTSWRDVFDAFKLLPTKYSDYNKARLIAKKVRYEFIAFNGYVYSVDDKNMDHPICKSNDLS